LCHLGLGSSSWGWFGKKSQNPPTSAQKSNSHPNMQHKPPPSHAHYPTHLTPSKSTPGPSAAASPSASSSPLHAQSLPYYHPPSVFQSNAPYLASNASPSQLDGLTDKEEFQLRAHTCVFMSGMGQKLKLGQLALATASVFVQVFFTHYSFKAVDRLVSRRRQEGVEHCLSSCDLVLTDLF
jgi:hypothetical protein